MPRRAYKYSLAAGKVRARPGATQTAGFGDEGRSLAWADDQARKRREQIDELAASRRALDASRFRDSVVTLADHFHTRAA